MKILAIILLISSLFRLIGSTLLANKDQLNKLNLLSDEKGLMALFIIALESIVGIFCSLFILSL